MKRTLFGMTALALVTIVAVSGCSSSKTNPVDPLAGFQPQINNATDDFQFQATAIEDVSGTVNYSWANTGAQATINHSSTVDSGTATLYVYDNNDSLVYTNGLSASLNESTQTGVAGNWRIRVVMNNCWGTLNFRAQML